MIWLVCRGLLVNVPRNERLRPSCVKCFKLTSFNHFTVEDFVNAAWKLHHKRRFRRNPWNTSHAAMWDTKAAENTTQHNLAGESGEIVATDLIVCLDGHFVGEHFNVPPRPNITLSVLFCMKSTCEHIEQKERNVSFTTVNAMRNAQVLWSNNCW